MFLKLNFGEKINPRKSQNFSEKSNLGKNGNFAGQSNLHKSFGEKVEYSQK